MTFAIHADGFVYNVDIFALRNGGYRTFWFASSAIDAFFIDPVWHFNLQGFI
jgi:hypothetical protein